MLFLCSSTGSPQFLREYSPAPACSLPQTTVDICSAMEHLFLLSPCCSFCCLSLFSHPSSSWHFLPFLEYVFTDTTDLADGLYCVWQWVHFGAKSGMGQPLVLFHRRHSAAATLPFTPNTRFNIYDMIESDSCPSPSLASPSDI